MDFAIGPRIADARERAGISVEELARRARVSISALAALEAGGLVDLLTAAVSRIARELDVELADLAEAKAHASQPSVFFRQRGVPDFFDKDRALVVDALRQARSVSVVDALLARTYKRSAFTPVAVGSVPYQQGYDLAERVRRVIGLPVEPLGSMRDLIEDDFGVPVVMADFNVPNLLALTAKEKESTHVAVIVNAKHSGNTRVDLAHELAHVLFDEPAKEIDYWIDLENDQEAETSKTEQRAKAFAAEFLIPRRGLIATFGHAHERLQERASPVASLDLARRVGEHFRTPPELTTNHLVNHNYIARELRDAILKSLALAAPVVAKRPPMLHRRLAEALGAGLLTQMRARELLGLSAWDTLPTTVKQSP